MQSVDTAWESFLESGHGGNKNLKLPANHKQGNLDKLIPKCSDIYISTQTKIAYLNQVIDLTKVFWALPVMQYHETKEGIIKKQMKVNSISKEEVAVVEERIAATDGIVIVDTISKIDNPNARKIKFKDVRKINVGLCKKDLTSYRTKRKGAFYNCFVVILRISDNDIFREAHVKVFNTGKLEIPGIQTTAFLYKVLDKLIEIVGEYCEKPLDYQKNDIETVLINSNFSCNYFIDRDKLAEILKYQYHIHVVYDPCSYPGIQCKFYYNEDNKANNGICSCEKKCSKKGSGKGQNQCLEISFMIFRTGSVLIVGHCDENILQKIYEYVKIVLLTEYEKIAIPGTRKTKEKNKKVWKKTILVTN